MQEVLRALISQRQLGQAPTDPEAMAAGCKHPGQFVNAAADCISALQGCIQIGIGHQQRELLLIDLAKQILGALLGAQQSRHIEQDLVGSLLAPALAKLAEVVKLDHQQGQGGIPLASPSQFRFCLFQEAGAGRKSANRLHRCQSA